LNIPHLAMNLARSQENSIQQLAIAMLPQLVGRKCALWIARSTVPTPLNCCAAEITCHRERRFTVTG
jgi:hypothetical protein